jgi:hypothetical protein
LNSALDQQLAEEAKLKNSQSYFLQELYANILDDIRKEYPTLHKELERDYSRLLSCLKYRGCSFFTIELPEIGKHFDKCLSQGLLTCSGLSQQRPFSNKAVVPRLFKGLLLKVFKASGELLAQPDVNSIRYLRQLYYGAKKIDMECTNERTWKQARSFFQVESNLRRASLSWDADDLDLSKRPNLHFGEGLDLNRDSDPDLFDLEKREEGPPGRLVDIFQSVCDIVSAELGWFNPSSYLPKHGPGAASGWQFGTSKYEFPHWPEKLESVFPMTEFAFANYGLWADACINGSLHNRFSSHEPPCVLIAVPKTQKAPRLISKEPICHQWAQQSILRYFEERCKQSYLGYFVDFSNQQRNRDLCFQASRTGDLITMDLSAASDRLSCWTVERAFRRNVSLLAALHASRTRWCENTIDPRLPKYLKLKKFANMGSACTFPVQSIVFMCAALASTLYVYEWIPSIRNIKLLEGKVCIFGDDIIVDKDVGECLSGLLTYLQLEVNQSKTHVTKVS